jgi:hypothetical protein
MANFVSTLGLRKGTRVLDLGGQPHIWEDVAVPLDITILNLPGVADRTSSRHHRITYIEGDACAVDMIADDEFDLAFSNSVIEHVGDRKRRADFAQEVRRFAGAYWVQTPAKWFPIECHSGMPFWWFYPEALRRYFLRQWRKKLPDWTRMVETSTCLERRELEELFPDGTILVERVLGIPKSYVAYRRRS